MTVGISRRTVLAGIALPLFAATPLADAYASENQLRERIAALEKQSGGRLGLALLDTRSGTSIAHRADERFAMCSTFKLLACAAVLARVDAGKERLDRRIVYSKVDLVEWSPVTEKHADGSGMALADICEAAMTLSDNTAGNLLLQSLGGPAGLTAFARSLGDEVSRLDRYETALNDVSPGDPRDTTTPAAMLSNLRKIVLGTALSAPSRKQITQWLLANKTGDRRLRAGLPSGWRVGDKTGTNRDGANDIAIAWPPDRAPIVISAYLAEMDVPMRERDAVIEKLGAIAAALG
ncbi:class A beta-lactamase [Chelativorans xinjiangense]|uniref:class A beta-lactamase n=1 Tax=Chelativorans xinjiangense TaxID=2681485 RepID=UPI001358C063|nr:class A beta-lactamase [Chelativorans xinjiangense]